MTEAARAERHIALKHHSSDEQRTTGAGTQRLGLSAADSYMRKCELDVKALRNAPASFRLRALVRGQLARPSCSTRFGLVHALDERAKQVGMRFDLFVSDRDN
jgi:hypothetical protein